MNDHINLKDLWHKQEAARPDEKEIFAKAAGLKKSIRTKLILLILVLTGTIAVILFVWYTSNLQMLTSKAGTSLVIFAVLLAIINSGKIIFSIKNNHIAEDNASYLKQLLQLKHQQEYTQTRVMTAYFILLSVGIALYMVEPTLKMDAAGMAIAYAATFCWIALNWFYIRPKTIKKQQEKINAIIEKLEAINRNMAEPE